MEPLKILLLVLGICIWSCNAFVNLTWTAEKDMLTLKCKTRPLIWSVQFLSPAGKEIAYCQIPFPSPRCYTTDESYITVNQDTTTNTTILTYKGISSSLNGQWKCIYGNNVDLDVVNVTIRVKDTSMDDRKDENCFEEFYAWTMLGVTMTIVIFLLYNTVYLLIGKKSGGCIFGEKKFVCDCLYGTFCSNKEKYSAVQTELPSIKADPVQGSLTENAIPDKDTPSVKADPVQGSLTGEADLDQVPPTVKADPVQGSLTENAIPDKYTPSEQKLIITVVLTVIVVVFPVGVGFITKDCRYKECFIIYGIFKALVMLIFSYNIGTYYVKAYQKRSPKKKNKFSSKKDTD